MKTTVIRIAFWVAVCGGALAAGPARARVQVVATLQDLGSVVRYVGGDDVTVKVLCPGQMDPHYLPAKPSLARKRGKADMLVYNGLELEVGWLPQLIRKARNPAIRPGSKGDVDCSAAVTDLLEVRGGNADRSEGDIHPQGNPHYTLDPRRMVQVARYLAQRLGRIDPSHATDYETRADAFAAEVAQRLPRWEAQTAVAQSDPVIIYHRNWAYLVDWLHLNVIGEIEHRPGIAPSPRHVEDIIVLGRDRPHLLVLAAAWDHKHVAEEVARRSGGALVTVAAQPGVEAGVDDYLSLIDHICEGLAIAAARAGE